MPNQSCPNCSHVIDTSVFVTGQKIPCPKCQLHIEIVRSDVSQLRSARPGSSNRMTVAPRGEEERAEKSVTRAANGGTEIFGEAADHLAPPVESSAGTAMVDTLVRAALNIPGYDLKHVLGRGGMGEVWQARQLSLGREVAVKVLAAELSRTHDFVKRFEKEAAALAALSHAGIVQIIDRGTAEGVPYFVMEYVHGQSLRDLMESKKLAPSDVLKIVIQVGAAIDYAHTHGVIHRDLKPENILLDTEGHVKVADFGLAGMRDARFNVTQTAMTMGTLNYMAPEQRKDAKYVDGRADIFSLGVMLYELLTGDVPVGRFKLPSEALPGLDTRIDAVVVKALESEPDARFQTASEMTCALESLVTTLSLPASALPDAPRPPRPANHETKPDSPGNVVTVAQPSSTPPEQVVSTIHHVGRRVVRVFGGIFFFVGLLAVATALGHRQFVEVEPGEIKILGITLSRSSAATLDAGGVAPANEPLPADTHGDVAIDISQPEPGASGSVITSTLASGHGDTLIAFDGSWTADANGLTARVFGKQEKHGAKPRATLEEPSFQLKDLSAQVEVSVDPAPPRGYAPKVPRASIFFHAGDALFEVSMILGDDPLYQLNARYVEADGQTRSVIAGDGELNLIAPPDAGTRVTLRLVAKGGALQVLADNKPVLPKALEIPASQLNELGRVGLACEEATCHFASLRIEGRAEKDKALAQDDEHTHLVTGP